MQHLLRRIYSNQRLTAIVIIVIFVVTSLIVFHKCDDDSASVKSSSSNVRTESSFSPEWFAKECVRLDPSQFTVDRLVDIRGMWCNVRRNQRCRELCDKFDGIYSLSLRHGQVELPDTFVPKVRKWLGNDEELLKELSHQPVTSVFNLYTHESTIFTPVRAKRPGSGGVSADADKYVEELNNQSQDNCDFCNYERMTARSNFPRVESKLTASSSNTFVYEGFHGIIFPRTHHPTKITEEQFMDMMETTVKWFKTAHNKNRSFKYPHMMWDILPKASASQPHPHVQVSLAPTHHYGLMEHLRISAQQYAKDHSDRNYFTDLIEIHHSMGLAVHMGHAVAIAYLTPKKENEVIVMSKTANSDFFRLFFCAIQALFDQKLYAISSATVYPNMDHFDDPPPDDLPAMARIISRGGATSPRGDISSMELFGASNVNSDPWKVIKDVRQSIAKRIRNTKEF